MATELSRQSTIEGILRDLIENGEFGGAIVATDDGLPIATVKSSNVDVRLIGAVAASIKTLAKRAHQELNEISLRDTKGGVVVSRYFSISAPQGEFSLLLAVQVPRKKSFRRLINQAVRKIQRVWAD